MKKIALSLNVLALIVILLGTTRCNSVNVPSQFSSNTPSAIPTPPPTQDPNDNVVVRSRAFLQMGGEQLNAFRKFWNMLAPVAFAASGSQTILVQSSPNVTFALDNQNWVVPAMTNAQLEFGRLQVSDLLDNNLKVCGSKGTSKCNTALIRVYTTGQDRAGLYNVEDQFGAPISANLAGQPPLTVGLGSDNAAIVQTVSIANKKNVIRLSDFTTTPDFLFHVDFRDAGAGNYSTTIVVEYALSSN